MVLDAYFSFPTWCYITYSRHAKNTWSTSSSQYFCMTAAAQEDPHDYAKYSNWNNVIVPWPFNMSVVGMHTSISYTPYRLEQHLSTLSVVILSYSLIGLLWYILNIIETIDSCFGYHHWRDIHKYHGCYGQYRNHYISHIGVLSTIEQHNCKKYSRANMSWVSRTANVVYLIWALVCVGPCFVPQWTQLERKRLTVG